MYGIEVRNRVLLPHVTHLSVRDLREGLLRSVTLGTQRQENSERDKDATLDELLREPDADAGEEDAQRCRYVGLGEIVARVALHEEACFDAREVA